MPPEFIVLEDDGDIAPFFAPEIFAVTLYRFAACDVTDPSASELWVVTAEMKVAVVKAMHRERIDKRDAAQSQIADAKCGLIVSPIKDVEGRSRDGYGYHARRAIKRISARGYAVKYFLYSPTHN